MTVPKMLRHRSKMIPGPDTITFAGFERVLYCILEHKYLSSHNAALVSCISCCMLFVCIVVDIARLVPVYSDAGNVLIRPQTTAVHQ